jgi:glycosyltransferase involved in cell wall biosynthesis
MNILMTLANSFTHDPRVYNEARSLVKAGHSVTVLAWDKKKIHPAIELKDGVNVIRSRNTKFMDLLPYDIFRLHFWWNKGYKDALKLYERNPFDVIHCHDLSSLPIGVKLKKKLGLPLIYDAHEIWGYMIKRDLPWWRYYLYSEKKLVSFTDYVITVAEPHEAYFHKMGCKKVTLVRNCKQIFMKTYSSPDNKVFTLIYIGGLNDVRFIQEAIEVCQSMKNVNFRIAGYGPIEPVVKKLAEAAIYSNVEFIGKISMSKVIPETAKGDVIMCMLNPNNLNNRVGPPNKLFEAMVCGRPVIATKGTYSGDLVEKLQMGLTVDFDKEDFKKAIIKLRDNPKLREEYGKNALNAALNKYNWDVQNDNLLKVYEIVREDT